MIDAGTLRHRVTLQQRSTVRDVYNEMNDYTDFCTVNAGINTLSGREFFAAEQMQSEVTHKITMRYLPGVRPDMRVKYRNRIFEIKYIMDYMERNAVLTLMCRELF